MSRLITRMTSRARGRKYFSFLWFVHVIPQSSGLYQKHGDEQIDNEIDEQSEAKEIS